MAAALSFIIDCPAAKRNVKTGRDKKALRPLGAQGFGGSVDANLRVNLAQQQYTLQQSGRDVSVQPVLQSLAAKDFLLGKANWTMNLTAQGKTLPALIASVLIYAGGMALTFWASARRYEKVDL